MTFTQYLSPARTAEVRQAILTALGYDAFTRSALLTGLPIGYRSLLPGGGAPPAIGLQVDLAQLNTTRRLVDEVVPLAVFLDNALGLISEAAAVAVLQAARDEVEATGSGAVPGAGTADVEKSIVQATNPGAPPVVVEPVDRLEKIIARDDMLPFGFLAAGVVAGQAVAKLLVPRIENGTPVLLGGGQAKRYLGTGWLVGANLLMTNHHVVNARDTGEGAASAADLQAQAQAMSVQFDYDSEHSAGTMVTVAELVTSDPGLDYALLRLTGDGRPALTLSTHAVANISPSSAVAVNVIQHPDGNPKRFGIRNNLVSSATPTQIKYFTDTLGGSSGSPVLNDLWQVVGLHCGSSFENNVNFQGSTVAYVNVGTQITAILDHLRTTHAGLLPELEI